KADRRGDLPQADPESPNGAAHLRVGGVAEVAQVDFADRRWKGVSREALSERGVDLPDPLVEVERREVRLEVLRVEVEFNTEDLGLLGVGLSHLQRVEDRHGSSGELACGSLSGVLGL